MDKIYYGTDNIFKGPKPTFLEWPVFYIGILTGMENKYINLHIKNTVSYFTECN